MDEHIYKLKGIEQPISKEINPLSNPIQETTPVTEHKEVTESIDRPHSATYFEIQAWPELLLSPELDINGIKDKVIFVESYISNKLQENSMKVNSSAFNKMLGHLEAHLGLDKAIDEPISRLNKIYDMLFVINKTNKDRINKEKYLSSLISKD